MNCFCFSITSAIVAELILGVLGHSKVASLAVFWFFCYCLFLLLVVGLKAELGPFLHYVFYSCTKKLQC